MAQSLPEQLPIPQLSRDPTIVIFRKLTIRQLLLLRKTNKAWKVFAENLIRQRLDLQGHYGSAPFEKMVKWVKTLPKNFQDAVLDCSNPAIWTRDNVIKIARIIRKRQLTLYLTQSFHLPPESAKLFSSFNGAIALEEGLIAPEEAAKFKDRTPLIDETQDINQEVFEIASVMRIAKFFHPDNGLQALREKLLTFKQITEFSTELTSLLLSDNGFTALREGSITPEEIHQLKKIPNLPTSLSNKNLIKFRKARALSIVDTLRKNLDVGNALLEPLNTYYAQLETFYDSLIAQSDQPVILPISSAVFKMTKIMFDEDSMPEQKQQIIKEFDDLYRDAIKNFTATTQIFGLDVTFFKLALFVATALVIFAAIGAIAAGIIFAAGHVAGGLAVTLASGAIGGAAPATILTGIPAAGIATKLLFFTPKLRRSPGGKLTDAAKALANNFVDNEGNTRLIPTP